MIDVIIPVYNSSSTLRRTLESLVSQTCPDFNVIIVDDCSTDDSISIAEQFLPLLNLSILRSNACSGGPATPRNIAISYSKADYICFLDSDDIFHPQKIEIVSSYLNSNAVDVLFHPVVIFRDFSFLYSNLFPKLLHTVHLPLLWQFLDCYQLLIIYNNFICNSSLVISRTILDTFPISQEPSLVSFEDYDLLLRLSYNKFTFSYLPFELTAYYINPNSIQNPIRSIKSSVYFLKTSPSITFYPLLSYILLSSKYTLFLNSFSNITFKQFLRPLKYTLTLIYLIIVLFALLPPFLFLNLFSSRRSGIKVLSQ